MKKSLLPPCQQSGALRFKCLLTRSLYLITNESADAKFDSAVQIVISFLIGAIILGILITVFGDTISDWMTATTGSWFNASGVARPIVP